MEGLIISTDPGKKLKDHDSELIIATDPDKKLKDHDGESTIEIRPSWSTKRRLLLNIRPTRPFMAFLLLEIGQ
jgi:hypothetical protein